MEEGAVGGVSLTLPVCQSILVISPSQDSSCPMRSTIVRYFTGLAGLLLLLWQTWPASAAAIRCPDSLIVIQGKNSEDVNDACKAVISVSDFLRYVGLATPSGALVRLVGDRGPHALGPYELGTYDSRDNTIKVLGYDAAVKATRGNRAGIGRVTTRAEWRSFIVHELAHAAVHAGCDRTCPSRGVHECFAAVAQIASLPKRQVDALLTAAKDVDAYADFSEVSDIFYDINPHLFAMKCYKHYRQLSDPKGYFRHALDLSE